MEFPISFPWSFGDPDLVELEDLELGEDPSAARLSYERRVSACLEGLDLLLGQFDDAGEFAVRRAPRLRAIACALLDAIQDASNANWQLFTERWIETGVGAQLDQTGTVVGQPRGANDDIVYRAFLRARILVNRSSGKWRELILIMTTMGILISTITFEPEYPAAWIIRLTDAPSGFSGADAASLLEDAKLGGVRLVVEFPVAAAAASFTYRAGTPALESSTAIGYGRLADTTGGAYGSVRASDPMR